MVAMPVYPNGGRFTRRFLTRFRGGFTIFELFVASLITLFAYGISGHWLPMLPVGFIVSLAIAWNLRRLPTDERRVSKWLRAKLSYYNPLRPHHIRRGHRARFRRPSDLSGVVHVVGSGKEASPHGSQKRRRLGGR
jgi:hypothetical protein